MSTTFRTDDAAKYWRKFAEWLETQPAESRAGWLQRCVQEKGPAPDDLGDTLRQLITPFP